MRLASGLKAIRASSPPIWNGSPMRFPLTALKTLTWPQNAPAAISFPSWLNGKLRQPRGQPVWPSPRTRPVRTSTSASDGPDGWGPGLLRNLFIAIDFPSGLNTGSPLNGGIDGATVAITRRSAMLQTRIGAGPCSTAGIRPASRPLPLMNSALTFAVGESTSGAVGLPPRKLGHCWTTTAFRPRGRSSTTNPPPTGCRSAITPPTSVDPSSNPLARQTRKVPSCDAVATSPPSGLKAI